MARIGDGLGHEIPFRTAGVFAVHNASRLDGAAAGSIYIHPWTYVNREIRNQGGA
jgi:hypothetical protein